MEISPVSAVSFRQIDWRKLTAKEIIKYENTGVEVPNEYLQWAKQFQMDVNSDDDTTYEMAMSVSANAAVESGSESSEGGEAEGAEEEENLSAAERRDKMREQGFSRGAIAFAFAKDSRKMASEANESQGTVTQLSEQAASRTDSLEASIDGLLSQADSLKAEIQSLSEMNTSGTGRDVAKLASLNSLRQELKSLGVTGQSIAGNAEQDLNDYQAQIDEKSDFAADTIDTGNIARSMAKYLFILLFFWARRAGNSAIASGGKLQDKTKEASENNNSNFGRLNNAIRNILAKTGVPQLNVSESEETDENKKIEKSKDTDNQQSKEAEASTANLDEVLKYKMRKGEEPEA